MAAGFTPVDKLTLENTSMYVYHIRNGFQSTSMSFRIQFSKFQMLKENIVYTKPLEYKDWILNVLKKKRKDVILTLRTFNEYIHDVQCHLRYDDHFVTKPVCANKISGDTHVIELSSRTIYGQHNEFMKKDCLICEFYIVSSIGVKILRPVTESTIEWKNDHFVLFFNQNQVEPEDILVKDLTEVSWIDGENFTDFKIKTRLTFTNVNKCIIAARSKFFSDYLKENPNAEEIELDTPFQVLSLALQYIYWGRCQAETLSTTLGLIKLAKKLQMERLHEMCSNFVKLSMDAANVQLIRKRVSEMGENDLVMAADEFLRRNQT